MITDYHLVSERPHAIGGVQRVYRVGNWGLSLIDSPIAHSCPFAWEAAVTRYDDQGNWHLDYSTPLTDDVVVFDTEDEADEWISRAFAWFEKNPRKPSRRQDEKARHTRRMNKLRGWTAGRSIGRPRTS